MANDETESNLNYKTCRATTYPHTVYNFIPIHDIIVPALKLFEIRKIFTVCKHLLLLYLQIKTSYIFRYLRYVVYNHLKHTIK